MIQTERVIFREEKNPYMPGIPYYLALFPDDPACPGRINSVSLHFVNDPYYGTGEIAIFEPCCEIDFGYYYKTRIIHKNDSRAEKLLKAVTDYYSTEVPAKFRIVEKITH